MRRHEETPRESNPAPAKSATPSTPASSTPASSTPGRSGQPADVPLRDALRPAGPPRLELRVEHQPGSVVLHVEGEVDILTASKLGPRINGVIRTSTGDLVLDLRAVEFIDSTGLQMLLSTRRRLMAASRNLSVICKEGPVMRLLELTRLTEILRVTSS